MSSLSFVDTSNLRSNISAILSKIGFTNEKVVVKRNGKPITVIVSFEEYQNLLESKSKQEKNQTFDDMPMFS